MEAIDLPIWLLFQNIPDLLTILALLLLIKEIFSLSILESVIRTKSSLSKNFLFHVISYHFSKGKFMHRLLNLAVSLPMASKMPLPPAQTREKSDFTRKLDKTPRPYSLLWVMPLLA